MEVNQKVDKLIIDLCGYIQEGMKENPITDFVQLPGLIEALAKLKSVQDRS